MPPFPICSGYPELAGTSRDRPAGIFISCNKEVIMAWAFPLTEKQIKKKFKCSLDELRKRSDIRIVESIDPNKVIVVVLP